jgi:zinc protease
MRTPFFRRPSLAPFAILVALVVAALAPGTASATDVQRVVGPNGVEAWLVEDHANPVISVKLAVPGGAATDPSGKAGLANMATSLLTEGAGDMDSQAFQARLAEKAIKLSFDASSDHVYGSLQTLTKHRDTAADMLALALTDPRFDEQAVQRTRSQILANLARKSTRPPSRANRALDRVLFPEHPYGRRVEGREATVKAITRDDLSRFAARRFARERLIVGVAGDITPAELKTWLGRAFADLPRTGGDLPDVPETEVKGGGARVVIEQDVPQSWVVFGHGGIKRDDPDFYAAQIVDYILGGGSFASRLYNQVREKRGLVYSVYTYLNPMDRAAVYAGGLGTSNSQVGKAIEVVRAQWKKLAENGPTKDELADAKTHLIGSFPLRLSSTSKIARILVAMRRENLGIDYIDKRRQYINAVSLDDARRVAADLLKPDDLAVVVVGRPQGFEANRKPPTYDDVEG